MSINFNVGELSQGEAGLLDWVGEKFGAKEQFTSAGAIKYLGKITPGSEAFHGMQTRIGKAMSEKLTDNAVAMMSVSMVALPLVVGMGVVGVAAVPMLVVGAASTALGLAGLAVGALSGVVADKLAQRRMGKVLQDPAPSQVSATFSV